MMIDRDALKKNLIEYDEELKQVNKFIQNQLAMELGFSQKKAELKEKATELLFEYLVYDAKELKPEIAAVRDELAIIDLYNNRKVDVMAKLNAKKVGLEQRIHQGTHYFRSQGIDWRAETDEGRHTYWKDQYDNKMAEIADCTKSQLTALSKEVQQIMYDHGDVLKINKTKTLKQIEDRRKELAEIQTRYDAITTKFLRHPDEKLADEVLKLAHYVEETEWATEMISDLLDRKE